MKYPTMRFVFDRKKVATKKKKGLVQLEVLFQGKRKWIGTGVKVYADQWDDRKKVINSMDMLELNDCLDKQKAGIQQWINGLIERNEPFEFGKLESFLRFSDKSVTFLEFLEKRIEERNDLRTSTKRTHRKIVTSLQEFGRIVYMSDLTAANVMEYDNFLHGKGYMQPTVHSYHKLLKRYVHDALRMEYISKDPYDGIKVERGKSKLRRYLTEDELRRIIEAEIPTETIRRVRDLFVFQCYTGFSYVDLAAFNNKKIIQREGKYIVHDGRIKSEEDYYIVLLSPAVAILEKYGWKLPVISNQQYNMRLKIVADYAGIEKKLTTHMARHTFASICINNGVKIESLAKMMGHSNINTTQLYAKMLNTEVEKSFDELEEKIGLGK